MTGLQILGAVLLSLPFIAIIIVQLYAIGWQATLLIWGGVLTLVAVCSAGAFLLVGAFP